MNKRQTVATDILIGEIDVSVIFNLGLQPIFDSCLFVYGTKTEGFKGSQEEPAETKGCSVERIMMGTTDVTNEINDTAQETIQQYFDESL